MSAFSRGSVALALLLTTSACGGGSSVDSGNRAPTITIKSFTYSPNPVMAKVGDTITVTNEDGTSHTLTADDHSIDTGAFASGSKTFTVTSAGTVKFHCDIHNYMTGAIQVAGP